MTPPIMPITVIGSCRVYEPLRQAGVTLSQREVPAYTHNSKETLQLLRLNGKGAQNDEVMEKITSIPHGFHGFAQIPRARFFVVEISSIRVVRYRGWYLQINRFFLFCSQFSVGGLWHAHIASEAELKATLRALPNLPIDIDSIDYYEQEDEELMDDLRQIHHMLEGRVLFVSHFDCDERGEPIHQRSRIRACLTRLQAETGVGVFDPTPAMKAFGIRAAMRNLGHYNEPFEVKVRQLLRARLEEILPGQITEALPLAENMVDLRDRVGGKSVTLLGSAPGASIERHEADLLVCVNASALVLPVGIVPDIVIINTAVAAAPDAGQASRPRLHEMRTELLVVVESGTPLARALPVFAPVRRRSERHITRQQRTAFLEDFFQRPLSREYGGMHVPSTGFFACLLLLASGAKSVRMQGFSFEDGHSYLTETFKRGHLSIDRDVLRKLIERGSPIYVEESLQIKNAT